MNHDWQEATTTGDVAKVRALLDAGAAIDAKDKYNQTALMNAAARGDTAMVRLLVERGAALDITAKHNLSALMLAALRGHAEVAQILITAGADLNLRGSKAGLGFWHKTALELATGAEHNAIVELLRAAGAEYEL